MWWWLSLPLLILFGWGLVSTRRLLYPSPRTLSPPDTAAAWIQHAIPGLDGISIPVWQLAPEHPTGVVLACHGYFADRHQVLGIASRLKARGYEVLIMELRGHGVRPGPCTLGLREADDARAILRWAARQPGRQALPVGVLGLSMGASVVCQVAARDPTVKAVVADSIYGRLFPVLCRGLWQEYHLPAIPWAWCTWWGLQVVLRRRLSTQDAVRLAPRIQQPLLMIRGGQDQRVSRPVAEEVYARWAGPKERWDEPEAAHVGIFARDPERYAERVADFLSRYVR